jgi:hypothetical protein
MFRRRTHAAARASTEPHSVPGFATRNTLAETQHASRPPGGRFLGSGSTLGAPLSRRLPLWFQQLYAQLLYLPVGAGARSLSCLRLLLLAGQLALWALKVAVFRALVLLEH